MSKLHKRPWWQVHGPTWFSLLVVLPAVLYANFWTLIDLATFAKRVDVGWPQLMGVIGDTATNDLDDLSGGRISGQGWRVADDVVLSPKLLATNLAVGMAIVLGSALTIERACRRNELRVRFTVKAILAVSGAIASYVALIRDRTFGDWQPWYHLAEVASFVSFCATILAWFTLIDFFGIAWSRFTSQEKLR